MRRCITVFQNHHTTRRAVTELLRGQQRAVVAETDLMSLIQNQKVVERRMQAAVRPPMMTFVCFYFKYNCWIF